MTSVMVCAYLYLKIFVSLFGGPGQHSESKRQKVFVYAKKNREAIFFGVGGPSGPGPYRRTTGRRAARASTPNLGVKKFFSTPKKIAKRFFWRR